MADVVWFREDLRVSDNPALYFAARHSQSGLIGIYIFDHAFLKKHDTAACRVEFILRGLSQLSADLAAIHIPLLIVEVKKTTEIAPILAKVIQKNHGTALFFNRQYEIDESRRDVAVQKYLIAKNLVCYSYDDQVILPPGSVKTRQGGFFKVFTPYRRAWYEAFGLTHPSLLPAPKSQPVLTIRATPVPTQLQGFHSSIDPILWPAGTVEAQRRLKRFIDQDLLAYDRQRDFPAMAGTSQLSPYLATGMISARTCFLAALRANHGRLTTGEPGAVIWMTELIWREFYKHLLVAAPRISMNKAFQVKTEKFPWRYDRKLFRAWTHGKTGFPIIDAAMRQLNLTGWMHNRLRMIVAAFLAKNLRLDWRWGEKYFMQRLIDGDLAANNGGWQWSASTGVDAAPYFRVFNPLRQSRRFDPTGAFIRQYCPELAALSDKAIHAPSVEEAQQCHYPLPIVDFDETRREYIALYKKKVTHAK